MDQQAEQPDDDIVRAELRARLDGLVAIYRFGSSVYGETHSHSDVDIAVLTRAPLAPTQRFDLQERLATLLGRNVDLVDLTQASPVLAVQVIGRGLLLDDLDPDTRGRFEDRMLGAYVRLNEERRGILERLRQEGTVYGR